MSERERGGVRERERRGVRERGREIGSKLNKPNPWSRLRKQFIWQGGNSGKPRLMAHLQTYTHMHALAAHTHTHTHTYISKEATLASGRSQK